MVLSVALLVAFLGGVLPALLWLAFWLFEDRCEPEPKRYIFFTFLAGMVGVFLVYFPEKLLIPYLDPAFLSGSPANAPLLLGWAVLEELVKFGAAYYIALRSHVFNEPIDAIIYLVTAALGFSAAENFLFLYGSLQHSDLLHSIITGDLRFIGATLLHTLSSATIGVTLALSYFRSTAFRRFFALVGVILATTLHGMFNFFILGQGGDATFIVFLTIWFGIVAILLLIERVKFPARDYC